MSALTRDEREILDTLAERIAGHPFPAHAIALADVMRQALPDIDDVTIGRVLLAYGEVIRHARPAHDAQTTVQIYAGQALSAALDLTAIERGAQP